MPDATDRVNVSTYVPAHQRDTWREEAETLEMSQSEFVRSMVQAGRRGFSLDGESTKPEESGSSGATPRGNGLRMTVLELLREQGALDWDELAEALAGDLEERLEVALDELQRADRIQHSGRRGGYVLMEGDDGE